MLMANQLHLSDITPCDVKKAMTFQCMPIAIKKLAKRLVSPLTLWPVNCSSEHCPKKFNVISESLYCPVESNMQHSPKWFPSQSSCLCCNDLKKCRLIGTSITTTTAKSEKQWIPKSNKQCTGVHFINKIVRTILNNATLPTKSKNPILSITSRKTSSLVGIVGNHLHPSTNVQRSQNFPNMANSLQQKTNQTIWLFALYKKQHPIPWILTKWLIKSLN